MQFQGCSYSLPCANLGKGQTQNPDLDCLAIIDMLFIKSRLDIPNTSEGIVPLSVRLTIKPAYVFEIWWFCVWAINRIISITYYYYSSQYSSYS